MRTPAPQTSRAAGRASLSRCLPWLLLALLVGFAAAGCEPRPDAKPSNRDAGRPIRIVALGDSTTEAGWEGNAKAVYAERLAAALRARGVEVEMINAGLSNTTSLQAVARLDSDVRRHDPDYVIVQFGINDSWIDASEGRTTPRLTLDQYGDCLRSTVETLRSDGARVILMTPNPMRWSAMYGDELRDPALGFDFDDPRGLNRLLDVYAERAREVARQENVPLVDVLARFEAYGRAPGRDVRDLLIPNDDIHPNDAGHALIAEWLLEVILADLAADRTEAASPAAGAEPGFVSILPPLVAIVAALVFRQVIPALFFGVWLGAAAAGGLSPASVWTGLLDAVQVYVVGALADADHAAIIVFSLLIGGMVGIVSRAGGALGVVDYVVRFATNHRRAQLGMTGLGLAIFFDDYTNTLVVGNTMRPVADRLRVSREKLAYITDTTAAPITAVAFVTTWIGYEVGLIDAALAAIDSAEKPYLVFVHAVGYCYYPILALAFALMVSASGRDFGPMRLAEGRARRREAGGGEEASTPAGSDIDPRPGVEGRALVAIVPIGVLLVAVVAGLIVTGEGDSFRDIIGSADSYKALIWASLLGALVAGAMAIGSRALDVAETVDAWLAGINAMMMGIVVLVLAWSLSAVAASLGTADYLVELLGDAVAPPLLPTLVFLLACAIAFATGTSWGTLGILMPLVVPLTWAIAGGGADAASLPILYSAIACVLAGSVWGDHCSPISDTTIMSSMSSGCDHVAHVRTQMPYALLVAGVAVVCGTLPAGFGMPWWLGFPLGAAALWLALRFLGREG